MTSSRFPWDRAGHSPRVRSGLSHVLVLAVLASGLAVPLNRATVAPAEASGPPAIAAHQQAPPRSALTG